MNIQLKNVPSQKWLESYDEVIKEPYIKKKYDRSKRLLEKVVYIKKYLPLLKNGGHKVLDIGPGPGEFLEICRAYGNEAFGTDAPLIDCEMGDSYIKLSHLMSQRQELKISYEGLDMSSYSDSEFNVINSQGAIEQVFRDCLEGTSHKEEKNCMLLSWKEDEDTERTIMGFLKECHRCLKDNGVLLIYGNGAKNVKYYDSVIKKSSNKVGFKITYSKHSRLHLMKKI